MGIGLLTPFYPIVAPSPPIFVSVAGSINVLVAFPPSYTKLSIVAFMVVLKREPAILLVDTAFGVPDVMYGICIALSGVVICGSCDILVAIVYLGSRRIPST